MIICLGITSKAQEFSKGLISNVSPQLIILNNFTSINTENYSNENRFDKENPYTYIVLINNQEDETFQILYQTNFWDDVSYIALSNNLYRYFDCSHTLDLAFFNCSKKAKSSILKSIVIDEQIRCIIEKLKQCK